MLILQGFRQTYDNVWDIKNPRLHNISSLTLSDSSARVLETLAPHLANLATLKTNLDLDCTHFNVYRWNFLQLRELDYTVPSNGHYQALRSLYLFMLNHCRTVLESFSIEFASLATLQEERTPSQVYILISDTISKATALSMPANLWDRCPDLEKCFRKHLVTSPLTRLSLVAGGSWPSENFFAWDKPKLVELDVASRDPRADVMRDIALLRAHAPSLKSLTVHCVEGEGIKFTPIELSSFLQGVDTGGIRCVCVPVRRSKVHGWENKQNVE